MNYSNELTDQKYSLQRRVRRERQDEMVCLGIACLIGALGLPFDFSWTAYTVTIVILVAAMLLGLALDRSTWQSLSSVGNALFRFLLAVLVFSGILSGIYVSVEAVVSFLPARFPTLFNGDLSTVGGSIAMAIVALVTMFILSAAVAFAVGGMGRLARDRHGFFVHVGFAAIFGSVFLHLFIQIGLSLLHIIDVMAETDGLALLPFCLLSIVGWFVAPFGGRFGGFLRVGRLWSPREQQA